MKYVFYLSLQRLFERIEANYALDERKNVCRSSCKLSVTLSDLNLNLDVLTNFV
jgi:hypothetical protein